MGCVTKLTKIAKELMAVDFPNQKAMNDYLKVHPLAERRNHKVVETKVKGYKLPKGSQQEIKDVGGSLDDYWIKKDLEVTELYNNSLVAIYEDTDDFETYDLESLKQSIIENGIQNPIAVIKNEDGFYDVEGMHRLYIAEKLGLKTIPVYIQQ